MTGFEVRKLRMSLELSVAEYAKLLGVTPDTIYRWERNLTALRWPCFRWATKNNGCKRPTVFEGLRR